MSQNFVDLRMIYIIIIFLYGRKDGLTLNVDINVLLLNLTQNLLIVKRSCNVCSLFLMRYLTAGPVATALTTQVKRFVIPFTNSIIASHAN